jgi:hypothetical protein
LYRTDALVQTVLGDFDGDGDTDFLRAHETPSFNTLFFSDGAGGFVIDGSFVGNGYHLHNAAGTISVSVADLDGDDDLIRDHFNDNFDVALRSLQCPTEACGFTLYDELDLVFE